MVEEEIATPAAAAATGKARPGDPDATHRQAPAAFRKLVEHGHEVITLVDGRGVVRWATPSAERVLGWEPVELAGTSTFEFLHPDDAARVERLFGEALSSPAALAVAPFRFRHRDGSYRHLESTFVNRLADPDVRAFIVTSRDVTEREESLRRAARAEAALRATVERLRHDVLHDPLTGLPNRRLFLDRLAHALKRLRRRPDPGVAVLFLDVDRFKTINDSLGHVIGDHLLREVALRLSASVRPGDTVARLGGDEMTVLVDPAGTPQDAIAVADRIARAFETPFRLAEHELVLTTSIGIAFATPETARPEDLLRDADAALYRAKATGRARWAVFDPSMRASALDTLALENDLRGAAERGELSLAYQPIVSVPTGRVVRVEALVRWDHPVRGPLLPREFIGLAEETGLIVPLGRWVLDQACSQLRSWRARFPRHRLAVSVNVSARQLAQPSFVADVERALAENALPAGSLFLELTEGTLMENVEGAVGLLGELKSLGVGIEVDDFGTGYSSLAYLARLPVDSLKIDASFVSALGRRLEESEIARAIVHLGKALKLSVTAEGVERPEQLVALGAFGCDCAQGHLFAPASPPAALDPLFS